jgi:phage terminase large subunit-like protein
VIQLTDKQEALRVLAQGPAKHILAVGGSRSGKTFALCYGIDRRAWMAPGSRHLIYRKHAVAAKQAIGMDTLPKIHHLTGDAKPRWYSQDGLFVYPNGSEVWLSGLDSANVDKVLGKEYATIYGNETSEIAYGIREQVLTRLAQSTDRIEDRGPLPLKEYLDLNPTTTAHWTYSLFILGVNPVTGKEIDREAYAHIFINPYDNLSNLPRDVITTLEGLSDRQKRRFLKGEYSADVDEALWRRSMIQRLEAAPGDLDRIVIGLDPAASSNPGSDETGIVVAGLKGDGTNRRGYVLDDASGRFRPEEWARVALSLYHETEADCIVAEANNGGEMVEQVIRGIEAQGTKRPARIKLVHATRGKAVRAEPIVALYERKLVYHVGDFPALEDQMTSFTVDFDRRAQGYSPDRLDAMVWAFTELFPAMAKTAPKPSRPKRNAKPRFF